jgi:hypothetical protein
MIADPFLRWLVTAFFVLSAAECVFAVVSGPRRWINMVGQTLHFVMAVAMVVMAWPAGMALPTGAPMAFFLLAALWFVVVIFVQAGHRLVNGYHAVMMLAMAWMYAVMSGGLAARPADGQAAASSGGGHHNMPGMNMPDAPDAGDAVANPPFVDAVNWLFTVGFALAVVWWLYRGFVQHKAEPTQPRHRLLGVGAQVLMAAGMSLVFAAMA